VRIAGFAVVHPHEIPIRDLCNLRSEASSATTISVIVCLVWFLVCAIVAHSNRRYSPAEKEELLRKGGT
jgi:lysylphosphatidylglycerol synthetase-like protein (DUF2156 family)